MRFLLFLLVVVNLLVWAMGSGWLGAGLPGQSRVDRLMQPLAPEALRAAPGAADVPPMPTTAAAPSPSTSPAPASAATATQVAAIACVQSPPLDSDALKRVDAAMSDLNLGGRLSRLAETEGQQWAVVLGPFVDRPTAERKRDEISKLSVRDFAIVENVRGRYVSLGVYSSRANAQVRLDEVAKKGVSAARVDNRALQGSRTILQVRQVDAALKEKLDALGSQFNGAGWAECKP
jgi:hypothetical protein